MLGLLARFWHMSFMTGAEVQVQFSPGCFCDARGPSGSTATGSKRRVQPLRHVPEDWFGGRWFQVEPFIGIPQNKDENEMDWIAKDTLRVFVWTRMRIVSLCRPDGLLGIQEMGSQHVGQSQEAMGYV